MTWRGMKMAAPTKQIVLEENFNDLSSSTMNGVNCEDDGFGDNDSINSDYIENWGFSLKEVFKLATGFLKEQEGKALHLSYRDKLAFVAFTQQVTHGKFQAENSPPLGYLDVIGRDRRQAWSSLGDMTQSEAMAAFVSLLDNVCPQFKPYIQAHKCDLEEKERLRREAEDLRRQIAEEQERQRLEEETRHLEEMEKHRQLEQKRLIQEALNRQTYHQFKAYAEQQFPGNPEQQAVLIRQLQEQHYQQYMQQVLHQQLLKTQSNHTTPMATDKHNDTEDDDASLEPDTSEEAESPPLASASMWTRKDIKEFKESIRKEGGDGIIKVGHGETVTVRVPTHDDGTCLFWEFATDSYDVGFGVYFEWTKNPGTQVSVHISESEDDDEDEEEGEQAAADVERGVSLADKPPVSVVIPVYRRDCHEEVYAGSHVYPGQGIYLLKFDNSYSLWRSKTLYYRVYYTR